MFERYISIGWSGAGTEDQRYGLRVVEASRESAEGIVVNPPMPGATRWTRAECGRYLTQVLREDQPRCLVAMDFGFGYPWGADAAIFGVGGWGAMLGRLSGIYEQKETARAAAEKINSFESFRGHGPYRFDDNRTDLRFYLDHGISYYRQVEMRFRRPSASGTWGRGERWASVRSPGWPRSTA